MERREPARPALGPFCLVAAQVALLAALIWELDLEGSSFQQLFVAACGAFLVHSFLPLRLRAPLFLLLSLVGFWFVLGVRGTAALLAIGGALLAIAHLPLSWGLRVLLLLAAGGVLAFLRVGGLPVPWSGAVWPVLGSIFMFRLAAFLYDSSREATHAPWAQRLAYFFMLPNAAFVLFPVIDYKGFQRDYYSGDPLRIYELGVKWIFTGITHLLLYRLIYHHAAIAADAVRTPVDLAQYMVATFLLYLRVSGQFHVIVGTLHLFGFRLPETHHHYYLASSFTDFWRRINIYWKDFMLKTVYYPLVFRLRRRGNLRALVLATACVFAVSWAMHSYQWFWLRGSFPLRGPDLVFWGGLGALATLNAALEARSRQRASGASARRVLPARASLVLRTLATFSVICALWSLWMADSLEDWLALFVGLEPFRLRDVTPLQGVLLGGTLAVLLAGPLLERPAAAPVRGAAAAPRPAWRRAAPALGLLAFLVLVRALPTALPGSAAVSLVASLHERGMNRADQDRMVRGYYEDLVHVERFNTELFGGQERRAVYLHLLGGDFGASRRTDGFMQIELLPSVSSPWKLKPFSTNRWAMRDKEYDLAKPPNTRRIALLGSSQLMGWGVADDETFQWQLEDRLNAELSPRTGLHYELLNFGVSDFGALRNAVVYEQRALRFAPDAVLYTAHHREEANAVQALAHSVVAGHELPTEYLRDVVRRAGLDGDSSEAIAKRRLATFGDELVAQSYRQIAEDCRARGIAAAWVLLPQDVEEREEVDPELPQLARAAGFTSEVLLDVFAGHDPDALRVARSDHHPNAEGHRLIAERLYRFLLEHPQLLDGSD